jgi:transcriptional regulator with XRE-family HTH domain
VNFSDNVRKILDKIGYTHEDFAEAIGVTRPYVSALLSGRRQPSRKLVLKIKKVFQVLDQWWESGEGPMTVEDLSKWDNFKARREIVKIDYRPEAIVIADVVDDMLTRMTQIERSRFTVELLNYLRDHGAEEEDGTWRDE